MSIYFACKRASNQVIEKWGTDLDIDHVIVSIAATRSVDLEDLWRYLKSGKPLFSEATGTIFVLQSGVVAVYDVLLDDEESEDGENISSEDGGEVTFIETMQLDDAAYDIIMADYDATPFRKLFQGEFEQFMSLVGRNQ